MKKALTYALALALALSLTACVQPKTEQPTDPAPSTSAPEPIAAPEPIKDTTPEPEPEQTPAAPVETEDTQPPEETESEVEQVQLFTDCNETVYATGTVNIRASYTADSEKLGSLNKGDSTTRTGTAIAGTEAEGWSRIQLSDGTTAYISNQYLSTTKPVVQQQQTSGGGQQQTQQPTQSDSQQQPQPSGGQSQEDKNKADNEAAGQGLAGLKQWGEQHQGTGNGFYEGLPEGATIDENGNVTDPSVRVQG